MDSLVRRGMGAEWGKACAALGIAGALRMGGGPTTLPLKHPHRLPSHVSKTVLFTAKSGPPN